MTHPPHPHKPHHHTPHPPHTLPNPHPTPPHHHHPPPPSPPIATCMRHASLDRTTIGSDNGLSPIRRQAIIETNAGILSIGPLGTNFNEISIKIQNSSFRKMHLKISSAKWWPFCPGWDESRKPASIVFHSPRLILTPCGNRLWLYCYIYN